MAELFGIDATAIGDARPDVGTEVKIISVGTISRQGWMESRWLPSQGPLLRGSRRRKRRGA